MAAGSRRSSAGGRRLSAVDAIRLIEARRLSAQLALEGVDLNPPVATGRRSSLGGVNPGAAPAFLRAQRDRRNCCLCYACVLLSISLALAATVIIIIVPKLAKEAFTRQRREVSATLTASSTETGTAFAGLSPNSSNESSSASSVT